jgi:hypothetical protein
MMQQGAWASMLNTPQRGGARYTPAPVAAASGQPMVIQLRIGDRDLGEIVIDPLRKAIANRGGVVQAVIGQGGR